MLLEPSSLLRRRLLLPDEEVVADDAVVSDEAVVPEEASPDEAVFADEVADDEVADEVPLLLLLELPLEVPLELPLLPERPREAGAFSLPRPLLPDAAASEDCFFLAGGSSSERLRFSGWFSLWRSCDSASLLAATGDTVLEPDELQ